MIYGDLSNAFELAGVSSKHELWFYPFLVLPFFFLSFGLLVFLLLFLAMLRLPHIFLWYSFKERKNRIKEELPLFLNSLIWLLPIYPLSDAIRKAGHGTIKPICEDFWKSHSFGKNFSASLESFRIFEELDDVADILQKIYAAGGGTETLKNLSKALEARNLERFKKRSSKLQLFLTSYVLSSAVLPAAGSSISVVLGNTGQIFFVSSLLSLSLVVTWKLIA
ncbi:MAG: hypothetical protein GOV00_00985 [Candidatus Altiarchaeota archaeon]|nr:hypothetical protein [Candidatus Altiarchaeota archaeon]